MTVASGRWRTIHRWKISRRCQRVQAALQAQAPHTEAARHRRRWSVPSFRSERRV